MITKVLYLRPGQKQDRLGKQSQAACFGTMSNELSIYNGITQFASRNTRMPRQSAQAGVGRGFIVQLGDLSMRAP
jgi:hypothetical protein